MLTAVRINWRLWTILQAELLDPECQLPDDLRSNVLSLAQFIDKHTVEIIADPKPEKLNVLISINRELAPAACSATPPAKRATPASGPAPKAAPGGDRAVAVSV